MHFEACLEFFRLCMGSLDVLFFLRSPYNCSIVGGDCTCFAGQRRVLCRVRFMLAAFRL